MQRDSNSCRGRDMHTHGKKYMQKEMQACSVTYFHVRGPIFVHRDRHTCKITHGQRFMDMDIYCIHACVN